MTLTVTIPGDPVAKGRPRFTTKVNKNGKAFAQAYTPAKTRAAERSIAQFAAEAMGGRALFDEPLAVIIDCAFLWPKSVTKRRRADPNGYWKETRPDFDNIVKAVADSFNHVVWTDDGKVSLVLVRKFYSDHPCTTVRVYPLATGALAALWPIPSTPAELAPLQAALNAWRAR